MLNVNDLCSEATAGKCRARGLRKETLIIALRLLTVKALGRGCNLQ